MHPDGDCVDARDLQVSVLLVDDRPANRTALVAALAPLGLELIEAGSGHTALRELLARDFAAVLLDINLPDMSGYEVAELLRARPRNARMPILFVTAERDSEIDRERGYACGAVDYLITPVVPAILRAKVAVYADQYRIQRETLALSNRFAALVQVGLDLARAEAPVALMERCCDAARQIFGARYAGIAVTEHSPEPPQHFVASGLDDAVCTSVAAGIFDCPFARQVLGQIGSIAVAVSMGSADVIGLPPSHPAVTGILAYPIAVHNKPIGWMYAADRPGGGSFTPADAQIMMALAAQFGTAWDSLGISIELERLVAERTLQLQQIISELDAFAYSVSHDLRAPLRAIDSFAKILFEDYHDRLDIEGERLLLTVRRNTDRMAQLIDDLLAFSRLGKLDVACTTVDVSGLVRELWADLIPAAGDRQIEMRVGELPPAQADKAMLRQVLTNLLTNAIKFTSRRDKAIIEVTGGTDAGKSVYAIRDNGAGFDQAYAHKLFGVFQRLHDSDEFPGTGIGLAIVERIINKLGGQVWAEGQTDCGATFHFSLPSGDTEVFISRTATEQADRSQAGPAIPQPLSLAV
jgi:signal transduction histidine kinase/FixJ family two-component response regulator